MHRPLSHTEVEALNKASPVKVMTRVEKLTRWASLLRNCPHPVYMGHAIEHMAEHDRNILAWPFSPMRVAAQDPVFQDAGLAGESVGDAKRFFELSNEDIHAFTCNCGGQQTGKQMASRIEAIFKGAGFVNEIKSAIFG